MDFCFTRKEPSKYGDQCKQNINSNATSIIGGWRKAKVLSLILIKTSAKGVENVDMATESTG